MNSAMLGNIEKTTRRTPVPLYLSMQNRQQRNKLQARGYFYQRLGMFITYAILIVMSIIFLVPFLWLVSASLKNATQYYAVPIQWVPLPVNVSCGPASPRTRR